MKLNKQKFVVFLKKIMMTGTEQIKEAKFSFTDEGLKVGVQPESKTVKNFGMLLPQAFIAYEAIGDIAIQDLPTFVKLVSKFKDEISVTVTESKIKLDDGYKQVEFDLMDVQFIKDVSPIKDLTFDETFTVNISDIQEMIEDFKSVNDAAITLKLETVQKGLILSNTGKYKFKRNISVPEANGGVVTSMGDVFKNSIEALTHDCVFSMKTNFPIKILEKTEDSVINLVVAPTVSK